jgi:SAM-dependent methyltransferase
MLKPFTTKLKEGFLRILGRLTGRHAVLLSREAAREELIFPVDSDYRADGGALRLWLKEPEAGRLRVTLLGYETSWPTKALLQTEFLPYLGSALLEFELSSRRLTLAGQELGHASGFPTRRFAFRFEWEGADGRKRIRSTGHYLPSKMERAEESYFRGQNYVDHELQSAVDYPVVIELLRRHGVEGPVLEVGCATGGLLHAMEQAGIQGYGLDISEWAVQKAQERLGIERALVCNVETQPLPVGLTAHAPFRALLLWSTYEHFRNPLAVLVKLSALATPGTLLFIDTTNADSLSHKLFGAQWEGYFDSTHFGVEQASVSTLRRDLPALGWRISSLETRLVWDGCIDPLHLTLRDWYEHDARFRQLLATRDLGDFVNCVAVRE